MDRKWITNISRCSIPPRIDGVSSVLVFHIDCDSFYGREASTFGKLKEMDKHSESRSIFMQLFWKLLERLKEAAIKVTTEKQKKVQTKSVETDDTVDNLHVKPLLYDENDIIDDGGEGDELFSDDDDEGEDITITDDEEDLDGYDDDDALGSGGSKKRKRKGAVPKKMDKKKKENKKMKKKEMKDRSEYLESMGIDNEEEMHDFAGSTTKVFETYLETVAGADYDEKGVPNHVTGYRFWALIFDKLIDPNKIWAELVDQCIRANKYLIEGRKFGKKEENGGESNDAEQDKGYNGRRANRPTKVSIQSLQGWEKYKRIATRAQLASYCDLYYGMEKATLNVDELDKIPLSDVNSDLRATEIFNWGNALKIMENSKTPTYYMQGLSNAFYYMRRNDYSGLQSIHFPLRKLVYKMQWSELAPHVIIGKYLPEKDHHATNIVVKVLPVLLNDATMLDTDKSKDEDRQTKQQQEHEKSKKNHDDKMRRELLNKVMKANSKTFKGLDAYKSFDSNQLMCNSGIVDQILNVRSSMIEKMVSSPYTSILADSKRNIMQIRKWFARRKDQGMFSKLKNPERVARVLYLLNQQEVFGKYQADCISDRSDISPCGKELMAYAEINNIYNNDFEPETKYDPSLTTFVDSECKFYRRLKSIYQLINNFSVCSLAYKNSLDAYAVHFDRVHNHMLTYSNAGATGKSYIWRLIYNHFRVAKTVRWLTYETSRARTTEEENMNDEIVVFDEMERAILDKNNTGTNDKERSFKQLLSTNTVSAKILFIDPETGKRTTKLTYSECITVFFGSMNQPFECMTEPMRRRFHCATFDEQPYSKESILDKAVEKNLTDVNGMRIYVLVQDKKHHFIQIIVYHIEKLIYLGGLTEPSMDVSSLVLQHFSNQLMVRGYIEPNSTMYERVSTTARMNCILDAIYRLFLYKGSRYSKTYVQLKHLKDIDPLLFCNVQHIVSAIGESLDILINPVEIIVKEALRKIFREMANNVLRYKQTSKRIGLGLNFEYVSLAGFIRFDIKSGFKGFLVNIFNKILKMTDAKVRPSTDIIADCLKSWRERDFAAYYYDFARDPVTKEILQPERTYICQPYIKKQQPIAELSKEKQAYYVHYQWLFPGLSRDLEEKLKAVEDLSVIQDFTNDGSTMSEKFQKSKEKYTEIVKHYEDNPRYCDYWIEQIRNLSHVNLTGTKFQNKKEALDLDQNYRSKDVDITPEEIFEDIIKDLLSHRYQLAYRLATTNYRDCPSIRRILDVEPAKKDAKPLLIPLTSSITKTDKKFLEGIEKYLGTSKQSNGSIYYVDGDLDMLGLRKRQLDIYWQEDPISSQVLIDNPMEKLIKEQMSDQDTNSNTPKDGTKSSLLPSLTDKELASSMIVPQEDPESTLKESPEDQEEEEISIQAVGEEEEEETIFPESIEYFDEEEKARESEEEEDNLYEKKIKKDDTGSGFVKRNADIDYDTQVGYWQGVHLNQLYADQSKSLDKLTHANIKKIYESLDVYDTHDIYNDVDFKISDYVAYMDAENKPVYHWDILATHYDHVYVDEWINSMENDINFGITNSNSETGGKKNGIFVILRDQEYASEEAKKRVLQHNIKVYKMLCHHPFAWEDLDFKKNYSRSKNIGKYPEVYVKEEKNSTRLERVAQIESLSSDPKKLKDLLQSGQEGFKSFGFTQYYDERTKRYVTLENKVVMERAFSNICGSVYDEMNTIKEINTQRELERKKKKKQSVVVMEQEDEPEEDASDQDYEEEVTLLSSRDIKRQKREERQMDPEVTVDPNSW